MKTRILTFSLAALCGFIFATFLHAQGTAFTYQGRLAFNDAPAHGTYDVRFIPFNASDGGTLTGPILTNSATTVSNGLFTAALDFGEASFLGTNYWLEIAVRTNGNTDGFYTLLPRQRITPAPQAIASATALTALRLADVVKYNFVGSGRNAVVGGGYQNTNQGTNGTIAGGFQNLITTNGNYATVAGGSQNISGSDFATVGGGVRNVSGPAATVSGGYENAANNQYATVPGGLRNIAAGECSFAAGRYARTFGVGSFVWNGYLNPNLLLGDYQFQVFAQHGFSVDYFTQRADGGGQRWLYIGDNIPGSTLSAWNGARLTDAGVWANASDQHRKTDFQEVDPREILERLATLPVRSWRYTNEDAGVKHLGPTAQDFQTKFGLGTDDKTIGTVDADGVALTAIQGLNQKVNDELVRRDSENAELKRALNELQQVVNSLKQQINRGAR